jgi:hypothetical protein
MEKMFELKDGKFTARGPAVLLFAPVLMIIAAIGLVFAVVLIGVAGLLSVVSRVAQWAYGLGKRSA